jgi:hypothetical protein
MLSSSSVLFDFLYLDSNSISIVMVIFMTLLHNAFVTWQDAMDLVAGNYTVKRGSSSPFQLNGFESFAVSFYLGSKVPI